MEYATVDDFKSLKRELQSLHRQVEKSNVLLLSLIPEENVSAKERRELRAIFKEMQAGKATPWREVLKGQ